MIAFRIPFAGQEDLEELHKHLAREKKAYNLSGCLDANKAHLIYGLGYDLPHKLVITSDELRAKALCEDYRLYGDAYYYPARDLLFYQSDIRGNALTRERMRCLKALAEEEEVTVFTTIDALMDRMPPADQFKKALITIRQDEDISLEDLKHQLVNLGYENVQQVEHPGEFASRGGIIDVYPLTEENPYRIELWGDTVDSIRVFDADSQKSLENTEEALIYPAMELILDDDRLQDGLLAMEADAKKLSARLQEQTKLAEAHRIRTETDRLIENVRNGLDTQQIETHLNYFYEKTYSLLDYFDPETVLFLDEVRHLKERGNALELEFTQSMTNRLAAGYILPRQMEMLYSTQEILDRICQHAVLAMSTLDSKETSIRISEHYHIHANGISSYNNRFDLLVSDLKTYRKNKFRVILLCSSKTRAKRLSEDLTENELSAFYSEDLEHEIHPGEIFVTAGNLRAGYAYPDAAFAMISESDIFGIRRTAKRRVKHKYSGEHIAEFADLNVGDYVVHENHGLGIYRGIEQIEVDHILKDYIKIEYAKGGNLYILASQLNLIQKYKGGSEGRAPKLNTLGGQEWTKTKSRVQTAVGQVAKELVDLYATRQQQSGFVYGEDTVWQKEFEESFPYEETDGQLMAIEAVKQDMMSKKIMDRLICGDVGYGKTEVAIRAAFKAVQENKQVVYLVPTTILAQQHYNTFVERMKNYPIRIELLCRFRTNAEIKKAIEGLKNGMVDIVIGTHRVLSDDVEYKDLGLLIIDEEQRFGVNHKEKIKQLKTNVDVLSLSATPIPRTLHMSLIGIRDMSVLDEAPLDRLPIQTFVFEYNEEMVREAIVRELARNGQVYYVYNKVKTIPEMAAQIQQLVPEANVAYAHGKMTESRLEEIMLDFINGEIDVLVSTTIIEIGLDISNVNTIIIHDSDNMGLSQLYQLRGRVGRSNRTAYAFFMYRRDKILKEVAEKRLEAIKEFSDLGSGFKIAMRDLEIRGAGNLLGLEQHGNMEAVGYDLYCKMLNEAVLEEKGEGEKLSFETTIDLDMDAYIPSGYIANESVKLEMYKRIAALENEEQRDEMLEELIDRFGEPPKSVLNLLQIARLKEKAHRCYFTEISQKNESLILTFFEQAKIDPTQLPALLQSYDPCLEFRTDALQLVLYYTKNSRVKSRPLLELLDEILSRVKEMTVE